MSEMWKSDLLQRLYDLDEDVSLIYSSNIRFQIIIVGGGALVLRNILARATSDIDVLAVDKQLVELMQPYDMNCNVNAYMNNFPFNYEDRLEPVWSGKSIDYYTASLEDIIISKLCSNRQDDHDDADSVSKHIDWTKLEYLAKSEDELRKNIFNDRAYNDFLSNYEEYKRRHRPCKH